MFKKLVNKIILGSFFEIELSSLERVIVQKSIKKKYYLALRRAFLYSLFSIFPILFLDTSVIISVLIPITMVAGTAWFAISLANMKQKFESFGLELTANLFEAFAISLGLLFLLSVGSLSSFFWQDFVSDLPYQSILRFISFILGTIIIGNIIFKIFIGSIKYDINDAMLTGQNETAERFYKKSLSLFSSTADWLKKGMPLHVANYYIGVAFSETFYYLKKIGVKNDELDELIETSDSLIKNPAVDQAKADKISLYLIKSFVESCENPIGSDSKKSLQIIFREIDSMEKNKGESQELVDTRLAFIFQEIANLLERQGETLFVIKKETS